VSVWVVSRQLEKIYLESVPSSEFGTELPFPVTEKIADAEFVIGDYRPNSEVQHQQNGDPKAAANITIDVLSFSSSCSY
jgi:hypothetical protein